MICSLVYTDILKYEVAEKCLLYEKAAGCGGT